ncbi:MAG: DJ-1/PfpI family protein [Bifidobacterium psychraerophilum]|uniref:DJ-1/PfpI family protein n=1 Tax=Bifidobacterium psychraerophilum TaxID=218140 RepID=UPI0039EB4C95
MKDIAILLFDGFEPLDVYGPAEVFGCIERLDTSGKAPRVIYCSLEGGIVHGSFNTDVQTIALSAVQDGVTMLIPGGPGTRVLVKDQEFLRTLRQQLPRFSQLLTVCTGSAVLAATGAIDGRRATSNKRSFTWVTSVREEVHWIGHARWVIDGDLVSSSGVSAGIDMALDVTARSYGRAFAQSLSTVIEYVWNDKSEEDPFAAV